MISRKLLPGLTMLFLVTNANGASAALGPERVVFENARGFDIATNGGVHLAVWEAGAAVFGQRIRASDGNFVGSRITIASSGFRAEQPAVASDGKDFLVAWVQGPDRGEIRVTRVTNEGGVLDPGGVLVDDAAEEAGGETIAVSHANPDVVWGGTNWFVAWRDSSFYDWATRGRLVNTAGEPLGGVRRLSTTSGPPWLASNGVDFLVIIPSSDGGPILQIVHSDGSIGEGSLLLRSVSAYDGSGKGIGGIASTDGDFITIYEAEASNGERELGLRIAQLDPVSANPKKDRQISAALDRPSRVAAWGGRYFLAWDEGSEVRVSRMGTDLEFLDGAAGFPVFRGARLAEIVYSENRAFVLAWRGNTLVGRTITFESTGE